MSTNMMPLEADTRVLIDRSLANLGWKFDGTEKNVFFEQPRTEEEHKKLAGKRPDYVLYSKDARPLIVIEAKKKGTRLDAALEQGIDYARILGAPLVFATDGVYCKTFHTGANRPPILNGEEIDEFIREVLALRYLDTYEVNTVSPKVQYDRKELIRIFDEANNMLRGDGLRAGIERFGEFANILFLKLVSESEQIKQESGISSGFDIESCSWDSIKRIPSATRIEYINNTVYKRLNDLYGTQIFTDLTIRDETILRDIMNKLDPLTLTDVDSDVKGDAFEYFLKASASTKNDLGEYFTPRHIVKTMVRLVNPKIGEKIYDPFCGTGGFLIESFRYIQRNMIIGNKELERILREETIYGNEITNTARITKMNMILAGDGHSNIQMRDSLATPINGEYDIVLANMPYSQRTKHGNLYDLPSANGDSICVQHCIKAINSAVPNGRMALVVPEGFLFRKDLTKTREYLLNHCQLQSIISLPQGVFLPYTGVKTDIIYATNVNQKIKVSEKRKDFWYFDVKSDGYTLDNHRRKIDIPSDLNKYEEYRKLDEDQIDDMLKVGFEIIPLDKVYQNSNVLVGSRYRSIKVANTKYSMINLGDERYFTVCSGGTPNSSMPEYWNGNINWITLSDLPADDCVTEIEKTERTISKLGLDNSNAKILPINTVVVSTRATIGRIGIARTKLATNQGFKNIIIKRLDEILPEYLAYALTFQKETMENLASGATFKEISKENFCTIQIPLIPIEQQQAIVNELDGYRRIIKGAQTVLKNYIPTIAVKPRWEMATVGELFEVVSDTINPTSEIGKVNYIGLENIESNTGKLLGQIETNIQTIKSTKRVFKNTDILFGKLRPALNKVVFPNMNGVCSTDIIVLRGKGKGVLPEFYSILFRDATFNRQVLNGVSGGQLPRIDVSYFLDLPIAKVPMQEQRNLLKEIQKEEELIESNELLISIFRSKIETSIKRFWEE